MDNILTHSRKPDISFYASGRIDIAARIARLLHLEDGDVIDVGVSNGETYLFVKHRSVNVIGRHEGRCFSTSRGKGMFRTWSVRLAREMMRLSNATESKCLRVPCGQGFIKDEVFYLPIINQYKL